MTKLKVSNIKLIKTLCSNLRKFRVMDKELYSPNFTFLFIDISNYLRETINERE